MPANQDDLGSSAAPPRAATATNSTNSPVPNPLHGYASYTYGISLHALSPLDYNNLITTPKNKKFTVTLISSASRYQSSRPPEFKDDFFFDSLVLRTIIGLNSTTKATNAIDLEFTILEPYGMTLMDRLVNMSTGILGVKNYLEIPYVLEINFFGQDETGSMSKALPYTKLIPIKIINLQIRTGVKGSEYSIKAVPFNHQAMFESVQATKANFQVTAKTVGDFFKSSSGSGTSVSDSNRNSPVPDQQRQPAAVTPSSSVRNVQGSTAGSGNTNQTLNAATDSTTIVTPSYTAAYNSWNSQRKDQSTTQLSDVIEFDIDPDIAAAKITISDKTPLARTPFGDTTTNSGKVNGLRANSPRLTANTSVSGVSLDKQV